MEYPDDPTTFDIQDFYLIGTDLLIVPVTQQGQQTASAYLPGNEPWYDYETGKKFASKQTVTVPTPMTSIPVFQRGGSIIPTKERVRRASSLMINDPYTLRVALDSNVFLFHNLNQILTRV